ncbi:MAG: EAL domain-containing protein, partial [Methylococcaceae bacterium]
DLILEVAEIRAMEDLPGLIRVINACQKLGVKFILDNFGTGYSSLNCLKCLPVSQLKIDQSIIRDLLDDPDDRSLLEGILGLATAFRVDVIAEGVETVEQGTQLRKLGCDQAQGYVIARPMPADQLPGWSGYLATRSDLGGAAFARGLTLKRAH